MENNVEAEHVQELEINADIANIEFITHDKKQIDMVLETFKNGPELQMNFVNGKLEVNVKHPWEQWNIRISNHKFCKLVLKLPRNFADCYTIQTSAGNIHAADLAFKIAFMKTSAGNINLEKIQAEKLELESGAGNIQVQELETKELTVQSGAGNIEGNACIGDITAKTGTGTVRFTVDGDENLTMKSGAGNIEVFFMHPEHLNATIKANAGLGNVKVDLPSFMNENKSSNLACVIGTGEKIFQFKTGVGNIQLFAE